MHIINMKSEHPKSQPTRQTPGLIPCLPAIIHLGGMPSALIIQVVLGRPMSYHAATLRLLSSEPTCSPATRAAVQETERRLGLSLPPLVREWYSYENAIEILAEHS